MSVHKITVISNILVGAISVGVVGTLFYLGYGAGRKKPISHVFNETENAFLSLSDEIAEKNHHQQSLKRLQVKQQKSLDEAKLTKLQLQHLLAQQQKSKSILEEKITGLEDDLSTLETEISDIDKSLIDANDRLKEERAEQVKLGALITFTKAIKGEKEELTRKYALLKKVHIMSLARTTNQLTNKTKDKEEKEEKVKEQLIKIQSKEKAYVDQISAIADSKEKLEAGKIELIKVVEKHEEQKLLKEQAQRIYERKQRELQFLNELKAKKETIKNEKQLEQKRAKNNYISALASYSVVCHTEMTDENCEDSIGSSEFVLEEHKSYLTSKGIFNLLTMLFAIVKKDIDDLQSDFYQAEKEERELQLNLNNIDSALAKLSSVKTEVERAHKEANKEYEDAIQKMPNIFNAYQDELKKLDPLKQELFKVSDEIAILERELNNLNIQSEQINHNEVVVKGNLENITAKLDLQEKQEKTSLSNSQKLEEEIIKNRSSLDAKTNDQIIKSKELLKAREALQLISAEVQKTEQYIYGHDINLSHTLREVEDIKQKIKELAVEITHTSGQLRASPTLTL